MTTDQADVVNQGEFKPAWKPFVWRPTFWVAIPCAMLVAASFFFWVPFTWVFGTYTIAVPAVAVTIPLLVLVERLIRFGKTAYEVRRDRIVVRTGTLFRERTVELDLRNITLVEWSSPFFLRTFYGVGHVTAQEAGSASKPAHLAYVDDPERLYHRIAELMSARGFSMQRGRRIQEERPGHLGAAVDLTVLQFRLFWVLGLILAQSLPDLVTVLVGDGASLLQLILGKYEIFSEWLGPGAFTRARIGVVLLGGVSVAIAAGWLVVLYVDLLHRTYTLYDDVIDYVDGFLNETRKFIPLENLADTQVERPFYKRPLGLSDVTLSSQGAENAISFKSTPDGPAFAESIRRLVEQLRLAPDDAAPEVEERARRAEEPVEIGRSGRSEQSVPSREPSDAVLKEARQPQFERAMMTGAAASLGLSVPWVLAGAVPVLVGGSQAFELGGVAVPGLIGVFAVSIGVLGVGAAAGGGWWAVKAWATEFYLDADGAHHSYDLFSRDDRRFALERITSVSVYRNPLDWIAGTMTLRFRSIGSDEDIDFWGIDYDQRMLREVRARLGLPERDTGGDALDPAYTIGDGIAAVGPWYAAPALLIALLTGVFAWFPVPGGVWIAASLVTVALLAAIGHQLVRAIRLEQIQGTISSHCVDVSDGVVRDFRHLSPLEHVRAVVSRRYPGSDCGRLSFKTAGFPIRVGHVPSVEEVHQRVDERLGLGASQGKPVGRGGQQVLATLEPSAATEAIRYSYLLLVGAGVVVVPYVWVYYRLVDYTVESGRLVADAGMYFDRRTTVLFGRVDHIETNRKFAHQLLGTANLEVYTVGSRERDLIFRSIPRDAEAIDVVRRRLDFEEG